MYIKKICDANIGPIEKASIIFPFDDENCPKPVIVVGENGTGKSALLSNIVDAIYEIASNAYSDAMQQAQQSGLGYEYYKQISASEIHVGQEYMYSYIEFENLESDPTKIEYMFKCGRITRDAFKESTGITPGNQITWEENGNFKAAVINKETAESIFSKEVLCFFGPERYERPTWMGNQYYELADFEHPSIRKNYAGILGKPITITNVTAKNLQWLLDIIVDSRCDVIKNGSSLQIANISVQNLLALGTARSNLETIMSKILGVDVYFGLNLRNTNYSRFNIRSKANSSILVPTLDALSTGQSALFNMFATIVRYADTNNINDSINFNDITGIVVIDEVELHLHSNLQREILPKLIHLFPKVQFIITTHSPLFLLGMDEQFGENGYEIYQMPSATKISSERFSEFQKAYTYLSQTQKYHQTLLSAIEANRSQMLVITEGSTDWKHMLAAYNELKSKSEYNEIFDTLQFEFLKYESPNSSTECETKLEMGWSTLCSLCENYAKLKQPRKMVFIADRDNKKANQILSSEGHRFKSWGNNVFSFILPIPESRRETPNICIEHLYSDEEIKTQYTDPKTRITRRLYMGNEFDERGISAQLGLICFRREICGPGKISIIEGSSNERITKISENDGINYALPKMEFAKKVLAKEVPFNNFNFSNFVELFSILKEISGYNDG